MQLKKDHIIITIHNYEPINKNYNIQILLNKIRNILKFYIRKKIIYKNLKLD